MRADRRGYAVLLIATCSSSKMSGYIVVTVDGKENLELECNTAGKFLISDLESLIGISAVGLKYVSETSRYRGVRVEAGELLEPNGCWQPESRI